MRLCRTSSAALAVVVVGGVGVPLAPLATAQDLATQSTTVQHPCTLVKPTALVGAKGQGTVVSPETVIARFPAAVAPGEVFTAYIQPGASAMRTTDGRQAGLLSYDIAFPGNSTNLGAYNNGAASGMSAPSGGPANVDRVNANGSRQEFGPFVRIWGGASAYLGDDSRNGDAVDRWKAGLQVASNTTFRFPEVALRLRAPVTAGGSTISVGLKGAGVSTGSSSNGASNTIQGAEQGGWGTERTNYFFCSSSANASSLSATTVNGSLPRYIARTSTDMTSEATHLPRSARSTTLSARVTTDEELMSNVRAGGAMMRFDIKDVATDTIIASPTASIDADGTASLTHQFPDLSGAEVRDNYEVTATYTGRPDDIESSTSSVVTISVGYNEINAGVTLRSANGALAGGVMPVDLTADLALPSGRAFPAMQIQLYRNGAPQGAPVPISAGGNTKTVTFPRENLTQQEATRTYIYQAVLTPVIINDLDRYAGQSAVSVAAIVTGSDPGSTLPEGGHGSLDMSSFFRDPALAWQTIGGSLTGSGTLSLAMGR